MEHTHPSTQPTVPRVSVIDTILHLHARPVQNTPNIDKHSEILFRISYFITFSSLTWSIINSYYFSLNLYTQPFFLIILGIFPLFPLTILFFFVPFFLHRVLRARTLLVSLITFDIVVIIVLVLLKDFSLDIAIFIDLCLYVAFINVFSIYVLVKQPLKALLYTVAADILYPTKLLLFKTLFKQICFNIFRHYYNSAAFIIHIMNYINIENKTEEGYLIISLIIGMLLFLCNFLLYVFIVKPEYGLFGYLLCINNTRRKLNISNSRGEFINDYIEVQNNNVNINALSNELNYLDVKQSLVDLEDKEVKEKFFVQPMKPYYFKYGPTPFPITTNNTQEVISSEMIETFRNSPLGFPLQVFNTEGSFVYSKLNNTDIEQATNTFITLSYYNGFIGLIKDTCSGVYTSAMSLITFSNIVLIAGLSIILLFIRNPSDCSSTMRIHIIIVFTYLYTASQLFKATNMIIWGYSKAMLYLLIGEKIELRNELKYERKLKRKLDEMCERDKII